MKVLKSGSGQKGWSTKTTCTGKGNGNGGCGADLLVEEGDLYKTSSGHYDGSVDYFTTFACPDCGVETDLEHVPSSVMNRISGKKKPSIKQRNTPVSFFLGSESNIKINALQQAVNESGIHAAIFSVKDASSDVAEQPLGAVEILMGAINRVTSAWRIDPKGEVYFAVENGIEEVEGKYLDYAIVLAFIPQNRQMAWVKSEAVEFDLDAVERTRKKEGGFILNTVGKTLQEMEMVKRHNDPHLDLVGKSRVEIIKDAFRELFNYLPIGYR